MIAAPAAAGQLATWQVLTELALVHALVTAAPAAVRLLNDARDAEADRAHHVRAHPVKRHRPVAAGRVPVAAACATGAAVAVPAPFTAARLSTPQVTAPPAAYLCMRLGTATASSTSWSWTSSWSPPGS